VGFGYTCGTSTGDALYVLGGRNAGGRCFRLDRPGAEWRWTELPPLRQPRVFAAVAVVSHWLIAAGGGFGMKYGAFDPSPVSTVEALDLAAPTQGWQELPHYPGIDRPSPMGAACAGRLYMFGGHRSMEQGMTAPDGYLATHLCPRLGDAFSYDPETARWSRLSHMPVALCGGAAVTVSDRHVLLLGGSHMSTRACEFPFEGQTIGGYGNRVFLYDTKSDTYSLLPETMPAGLNDIRACPVGDTIYCAGGESIDPRTSNTVNLLQVGRITRRAGPVNHHHRD